VNGFPDSFPIGQLVVTGYAISFQQQIEDRPIKGYFNKSMMLLRDETGTDNIRPTNRPKGLDTQMVRLYPNPDI
jgi:hypothetical protein